MLRVHSLFALFISATFAVCASALQPIGFAAPPSTNALTLRGDNSAVASRNPSLRLAANSAVTVAHATDCHCSQCNRLSHAAGCHCSSCASHSASCPCSACVSKTHSAGCACGHCAH
eukprot:2686795-Rhodomonas_salina.4